MDQFTASIFSTSTPVDLVIIAGLLLVFVLVAFFLGITRTKVLIVTTYVSYTLVTLTPTARELDKIELHPLLHGRVLLFLALVAALFLLFLVSGAFRDFRDTRTRLRSILYGIVQTGLVAMLVVSMLGPDQIETLSPLTQLLFASGDVRLVWAALPVFSLILFP